MVRELNPRLLAHAVTGRAMLPHDHKEFQFSNAIFAALDTFDSPPMHENQSKEKFLTEKGTEPATIRLHRARWSSNAAAIPLEHNT